MFLFHGESTISPVFIDVRKYGHELGLSTLWVQTFEPTKNRLECYALFNIFEVIFS